jgi:hypothetical protein
VQKAGKGFLNGRLKQEGKFRDFIWTQANIIQQQNTPSVASEPSKVRNK